MTIDERLDRLTERHNTLLQMLERMAQEQRAARLGSEHRESTFERNQVFAMQLREKTKNLARIAFRNSADSSGC
jgi:hypothetical protein